MKILLQVKFFVLIVLFTITSLYVLKAGNISKEVFTLKLSPIKDKDFFDKKKLCPERMVKAVMFEAKIYRDNCRKLFPEEEFCKNIKYDFENWMKNIKKHPHSLCPSVDKIYLREFLNEDCKKKKYTKLSDPISQKGSSSGNRNPFKDLNYTTIIYSCEGKKSEDFR